METIDKTQLVLKSLSESEKSTKALLDEIVYLGDRSAASLFMNNMVQRGLVYRWTNGYWKLTSKGKGVLSGEVVEDDQVQDSEEPEAPAEKQEETVAEFEPASHVGLDLAAGPDRTEVVDVPAGKIGGGVAFPNDVLPNALQIPEHQSEPASAEPGSAGIFEALRSVAVPEGASLILQREGVFVNFGGDQYSIERSGDIEAVFRAVELHAGAVSP